MIRILLLCLAVCTAGLTLSAQDMVEITFNVATSSITGDVNTIQLAGGGNFGEPGDNPMSDEDGDGVYTITVMREVGFSSFYTFTNGPCGDYSCKENIGGQDCARPDNFNDRRIENVTQDTVINTCFEQCTDAAVCGAPPAAFQVTFQLDLRGYEEAFTTPGVVGNFNGFDGNANPMTDEDGDSIWTATLELAAGPIDYKFQLDNYTVQDMLTADQECVFAFGDMGQFVNRVDTITADVALDPVCLNSCEPCRELPMDNMVSITFNVGTGAITGDVDTIQLAGGGNFGDPGDNPMSDEDGDGVYTITVMRPVGFSSFYTFTNGACPGFTCKEQIGGQDCANPNNFDDRFLPAVTQDTVINTCFGLCTDDLVCTPAETAAVTFQVDMSEVEQDFTVVGLVGTFNSFDGNANPMTDDDGDSIYTITLALPLGPIQYKFQADNYTVDEMLSADESCVMAFGDMGQFVNRVDTITGDVTFDVVCLNSCQSCEPTSTNDPSAYGISFDIRPTLVSEQLTLDLRQPNDIVSSIQVFSTSGRLVETRTLRGTTIEAIDVSTLASGTYFLRLSHRGAATVRRFVKR